MVTVGCRRGRKEWVLLKSLCGARAGIEASVIGALASRESNGGDALTHDGYGDHGRAWGILQVRFCVSPSPHQSALLINPPPPHARAFLPFFFLPVSKPLYPLAVSISCLSVKTELTNVNIVD